MLCACSGEQFKFDKAPQSPESLATRDFSASGLSSRVGDWESKFEDSQVDDVESTLKEALSLNYEEARALLGRLEFQRGNFDAALQVFQGINTRSITPRMSEAIAGRPQFSSMHSVSLLLEAILLKAKSLEALGCSKDAAKECRIILDTVESALSDGMLEGIAEDCKLQDVFHKALELLPKIWKQAGFLDEAIIAYRRALTKPWNLDPQKKAEFQKDLAAILLHGGGEASLPHHLQMWGPTTPKNNLEEALLLLFILMRKMVCQEIVWDPEVMDHLAFAISISGKLEFLADHFEQVLPGVYSRSERWYFLSLCYTAAGQDEVALNLVKKVLGPSESKNEPHLPSLMLGAKLCGQNPKHATLGLDFARRAIEATNHKNEHLMWRVHQLLGVCYGVSARGCVSDSKRFILQNESLKSLSEAALIESEDPEIMFNVGLENAVQRNLNAALESAKKYSDAIGGSSVRGWKLLALVISAEQHDCGRRDQLELLRLKAVLQIAQEQPRLAIATSRSLLGLIQAQKDLQTNNFDQVMADANLEVEAWQDLANIYTKHESWPNFYSPKSWHATGILFEAQSLYKEALVAFSLSLSIDPDYVPSMISTASVLRKLGKKSIPIAKTWLTLGFVSKMEGSLDQAADFFQAAHELRQSAPAQNYV
ncbi:hypothetical protein MKX01_023582 [Papaver californicum]|nr:hypothetical protein MKX01_023582 [Papaver californicum]